MRINWFGKRRTRGKATLKKIKTTQRENFEATEILAYKRKIIAHIVFQ